MSTDTPLIIAEDNPRDREFLQHTFPLREILFSTNGRGALELAKAQTTPLIISDLQMPELNGIQLAEILWRIKPSSRIVFWSQYNDEIYVRALLDIIPDETVYGYVLKSNPSEVLIKAVQAVFEDCQCWLDPQIRPVQVRAKKTDSSVNDLEYEVLVDIGLGLTDNIIAKRRYLSRRGVQNRLKSLYIKLGIDHEQLKADDLGEMLNMRTRAISIAMRRGLINSFELEQEEQKLQRWLEYQGLTY